MATKRRTSNRSSGGGSTLYGVLAGLLLGLIVAAGVAFYVTQAPMPFVDRASRQTEQASKPDPRQAPDPNGGLFGRDGAAGTAPSGPTATAPAPLPGLGTPGAPPPIADQNDDLGALIAGLPPEPQANRTAPPPAPATTKPPAPPRATPNPQSSGATGTYYLQAGAYRVLEDAESLRARIILLGLPVAIERAEVKNMQINRVRVGPFARLDDMNRARTQLGENKIESNVVRQ